MFASAPFFLRLQITEIAAEIVDRVCQGWQLQEPTDLGWFFSFFIFFFFFLFAERHRISLWPPAFLNMKPAIDLHCQSVRECV